jgi:TPR repeat protein
MTTRFLRSAILLFLTACGGAQASGGDPQIAGGGDASGSNGEVVDRPGCDGEAFEMCAAHCESGHGPSCGMLGNLQSFGKLAGGKVGAAKTWEKGCALKNTTSCENLGTALILGWTGPPNSERAFSLQQQSCDLGSVNGCYNLANYQLGGHGTPKDAIKAFTTLKTRVCKLGVAEADLPKGVAQYAMIKGCNLLGGMYVNGLGTPANCSRLP